jgi:hypothetical protein
METNPKKQRQHFYRDYASGQWSMSELCGRWECGRTKRPRIRRRRGASSASRVWQGVIRSEGLE